MALGASGSGAVEAAGTPSRRRVAKFHATTQTAPPPALLDTETQYEALYNELAQLEQSTRFPFPASGNQSFAIGGAVGAFSAGSTTPAQPPLVGGGTSARPSFAMQPSLRTSHGGSHTDLLLSRPQRVSTSGGAGATRATSSGADGIDVGEMVESRAEFTSVSPVVTSSPLGGGPSTPKKSSRTGSRQRTGSLQSLAGAASAVMRRKSTLHGAMPVSHRPSTAGGATSPTHPHRRVRTASAEVQVELGDETAEPLVLREQRIGAHHDVFTRIFFTLSTASKAMAMYGEGFEADLTCKVCFEVMTEPSILWPCGHTFCKACIRATMMEHEYGTTGDVLYICSDCNAICREGFVENVHLAQLCARWEFKRRSVGEPTRTMDGVRAVLAELAYRDETGAAARATEQVMSPPRVF
jgi:hypothetical protein